MNNTVYLLLGTNLGERNTNLVHARQSITETIGIIAEASSIYATAAWGDTDQPAFLNQCLGVHTTLSPTEVLKQIQQIEHAMGRIRYTKWGPRLIDIDILFYDDLVLRSPELTIPHPHLHERRFTLVPMNELAPSLKHPVLKKSISQLLKACPDQLEAVRL